MLIFQHNKAHEAIKLLLFTVFRGGCCRVPETLKQDG